MSGVVRTLVFKKLFFTAHWKIVFKKSFTITKNTFSLEHTHTQSEFQPKKKLERFKYKKWFEIQGSFARTTPMRGQFSLRPMKAFANYSNPWRHVQGAVLTSS